MALLGENFPTKLINTRDLRIERPGFSDDWGDETGTPVVIGTGLEAIVVPAKLRMLRGVDDEAEAQLAQIILPPDTAPPGILIKDVVRWTDFYGLVTNAEIQDIERVSGVEGLESVILKVGKG